MLVEMHIIQNHAPSNLNRDDTGSPKECVFGGVKRARISSQCLKRSIRRSDTFSEAFKEKLGTRTRQLPELVRAQLLAASVPEELASIAAKKVSGFGTNAGTERPPDAGLYDTAQTMFLTKYDVDAITEAVHTVIKEKKTAQKFEEVKSAELQSRAELAGYRPITVDIALFGRMTTSKAFRDVDATTQVAHAISTHRVDHEYDYFTAVDDLQGLSDDAGADMIGDVEFNSACYYKYFSVDYNGLVNNLTGKSSKGVSVSNSDLAEAKTTASAAVLSFLKAAIFVSPSGKQNSFAAHQLPAAVLIEVRPSATPISYANAFVNPVAVSLDRNPDVEGRSLEKLASHVTALNAGFGLAATGRYLLSPTHSDYEIPGVTKVPTLAELATLLQKALENG